MTQTMTFFLFARPSFWAGTAALLDFGNTLFEYNQSNTPSQADHFAIKSDWETVGRDLRHAVEQLSKELDSSTSEQKEPPR